MNEISYESVATHMEYTDPEASFEKKHLALIRMRLHNAREHYNETNGKLGRKETIDKLKEMGIIISHQTYDSLFDPFCFRTQINISAVIAICKLLDVNLSQILAYPNETSADQKGKEFYKFGDYWKVLDDMYYNGIFYCYFFRVSGTDSSFSKEYSHSLQKKEDLIEGKIEFKIDPQKGSLATFSYNVYLEDVNGNVIIKEKKAATCIPMMSSVNRNVYLKFIDNDGKIFQIVFDKQEFYNYKCYYRIAGMITESPNIGHLPIFQKMVMLDKKITDEYKDFIKGLLNLNAETLLITKEMLDSLEKTDDSIKKFKECYKDILETSEKSILVLNETSILKSNHGMSQSEKKEMLIKLRHHSFSQNQIYIGEDEYAHIIAKKIQRKIQSSSNE